MVFYLRMAPKHGMNLPLMGEVSQTTGTAVVALVAFLVAAALTYYYLKDKTYVQNADATLNQPLLHKYTVWAGVLAAAVAVVVVYMMHRKTEAQ